MQFEYLCIYIYINIRHQNDIVQQILSVIQTVDPISQNPTLANASTSSPFDGIGCCLGIID